MVIGSFRFDAQFKNLDGEMIVSKPELDAAVDKQTQLLAERAAKKKLLEDTVRPLQADVDAADLAVAEQNKVLHKLVDELN